MDAAKNTLVANVCYTASMICNEYYVCDSTAIEFRSVCTRVVGELKSQAEQRERKRRHDQLEVAYLEKMMETGGKRGRSRFSKLLSTMHPHRNLPIGAPLPGAGRSGVSAGTSNDAVGTHERKKKKKKSHSHHDRPSKGSSAVDTSSHKDNSKVSERDALQHQIAEIIRKHNNRASLDVIVSEFLKSTPKLALDEDEARSRISDAMSSSRKPYRFIKDPHTKTYSAERV